MKCIFCCVFNEEKYVDMFYLLLESIFIYGNLDDYTHVMIYTSTPFMNRIKQSSLFCESKIRFEINDTYNTVKKACEARLDLFNLSSFKNARYSKILYLDTDIIINGDLNTIFNLCKDDILYTQQEGTIADAFHGNTLLFGNTIDSYTDKSAFTSGILLFNNCDKIKFLFDEISKDIINRPYMFGCYDQPYVVYNAFIHNLYNNKILTPFVADLGDFNSTGVIHHFCGGPGCYKNKIQDMSIFLNKLKDATINNNIIKAKQYIDVHLMPIIKASRVPLEGNIFTVHHSTEYTDEYIIKAQNISNIVINRNIKSVMEIGFNAGFSSLLMLLSNPDLQITCFDIGEHKYVTQCYEKLRETFGERIRLVIGDSMKTLINVNEKYDLIHIDGGHSTLVATSDIVNSYRLSRQGTIIIMDDYNFSWLHDLWDKVVY